MKNLLWAEAGEGRAVTKEMVVATRTAITTTGHDVPVSKKVYLEWLRSFAVLVQAARRESYAAMRELEVQRSKVVELEFKTQLLMMMLERLLVCRKKSSAKTVQLAFTKSVLNTKEATKTVKANVRESDPLNYDFGYARAVVGRGERDIRDFAEWVCAGYTSSLHDHAGDYRSLMNVMLADAQLRGEYLGSYPVRIGNEGHSVYLEEDDSDEERGGRTPPCEDDSDLVVVLRPPHSF